MRSLLLAAFSLQALDARAEPTDEDRATARALAQEGNKALINKNYALAEDRFRRADALVHAPSLAVDHARALVALGRFAEAYASYDSARKEKLDAASPPAFKRAAADAEREIKPLESKVAFVTIAVWGPDAPLVKIDARDVPAQALGLPFPVDVGEHTIQVSGEGFVSKEATMTFAPGQHEDFVVELDAAPAPEAPPPPPPAPKIIVHRAAPPVERKTSPLAYAAFGVGGVGLAVGAVTGVLFLSERSKLRSACPTSTTCPSSEHADLSRFHAYSYASGIGIVAGLAGAGAGVAILLSKPKKPTEHPAAAHVVPYVAPGTVGLSGSF